LRNYKIAKFYSGFSKVPGSSVHKASVHKTSRIAAIDMLSLYLPAELLDRPRAEGYDFGAMTNIVFARVSRIGGVFSSETGKEGNEWNVVVY
jgi:hypothetical protein